MAKTTAVKHAQSVGAQAERKAIITYLRRKKPISDTISIETVLEWIHERRKRYDKRSGGLGRR